LPSFFALQYARFLAGKSPDRALAWAATIPDEMAHQVYYHLVNDTAASSPQTALNLMARIPAEHFREFNHVNFLPRNLKGTPRETLLWLNEHLGQASGWLNSSLCLFWARVDRTAATEWILSEAPKSQRESLLSWISQNQNALDDPASVLDWAGNLPDDCGGSAQGRAVTDFFEGRLPVLMEYLKPGNGSFTTARGSPNGGKMIARALRV